MRLITNKILYGVFFGTEAEAENLHNSDHSLDESEMPLPDPLYGEDVHAALALDGLIPPLETDFLI